MACVYHAEAPRTDEGRLAWSLFLGAAHRVQVVGMSYVAAIDLDGPRRMMLAAGADEDTTEDLLAACELGFTAALNDRKDREDGAED